MFDSSADDSSIRRLNGSFSRPRFLPARPDSVVVGGIKSSIGLKSSCSSESPAAVPKAWLFYGLRDGSSW